MPPFNRICNHDNFSQITSFCLLNNLLDTYPIVAENTGYTCQYTRVVLHLHTQEIAASYILYFHNRQILIAGTADPAGAPKPDIPGNITRAAKGEVVGTIVRGEE